jgi:hypothetical protein
MNEICGLEGSENLYCLLLLGMTQQSDTWLSIFWSNLLPPFSYSEDGGSIYATRVCSNGGIIINMEKLKKNLKTCPSYVMFTTNITLSHLGLNQGQPTT